MIIDCNLNWKAHVHELSKKLARSIGVLSKLRHFVPMGILIRLYHAIIFPFLIYSVIVWGNTYQSNLHPIVVLQKKAIRIITFSTFCDIMKFLWVGNYLNNFIVLRELKRFRSNSK